MAIFVAIFLLLMIVYAVLIDGYRKAWNSIPEPEKPANSASSFVSVIVALRNESVNINKLLDAFSAQTYPEQLWELILVDDFSTDDSCQKIKDYKGSISEKIVLISMEAEYGSEAKIQSHKKKAIETGIRKSQGSIIVTTDADCRFGPDWLTTLAAFFEKKKAHFVAAPVYIAPGKRLLGIFQSLDFMSLQGITGAVVSTNKMTMCNGANLAYSKESFGAVNGFEGIDGIPSGDDMLLMYKIYQQHPQSVFYIKDPLVVVETEAAANWKQFLNQRIRWASKASYYQDKRIFRVLLLVYIINVFFLVMGIASLFKATWFFFLLLFLLAKIIIEYPFVNAVSIFFNQQKLMKYFPLLQPLHIVYTIVAGWLGKFGSFEWKGRIIKTNSGRNG